MWNHPQNIGCRSKLFFEVPIEVVEEWRKGSPEKVTLQRKLVGITNPQFRARATKLCKIHLKFTTITTKHLPPTTIINKMASASIIRLPHLPYTSVHVSLFKDVKNAAFLRKQLMEGNAEFEYAFLDATMVTNTASRC